MHVYSEKNSEENLTAYAILSGPDAGDSEVSWFQGLNCKREGVRWEKTMGRG